MSELDELASRLSQIPDVEIERDIPASGLCTYRVGGPLAVVAYVGSHEALAATTAVVCGSDIETLALGRGSNLLVSDSGFRGLAFVLTDHFAAIDIDDTTIRAGGSAALPVVARASVAAGLRGFEWAVGVPGSIGGAVRMNAGGHGSDMAASLVSVDIADFGSGRIVTRTARSLDLGYRHSNIGRDEIVASATLGLEKGSTEEGAELLSEIVAWRREHQPGGPNAGSVFTNPQNDSAGRLIDEAGAKGLRIGTAEVSEKHANFIQSDPGGSADDVLGLMIELVDRVEAVHGIRLHAETRLVGFDADRVARVQHLAPRAERD